MPRVKPYIKKDPREMALRSEIGSIMGQLQLTQKELSKRTGIPKQTLSDRLTKDIGSMRMSEYWAIQDVARRAGI